jgi:hypothetical protein
MICSHCEKNKSDTEFYKRNDRMGYYSWCTRCMKKLGRTRKYPKIRDRGYGAIYG